MNFLAKIDEQDYWRILVEIMYTVNSEKSADGKIKFMKDWIAQLNDLSET